MRLFLNALLYAKLFLLIYSLKPYRLGRSNWGNLGVPSDSEDIATPPEEWFIQKLDHFAPTDVRTWLQRYFVNEDWYNKKDAIVFLMIGGEGPTDPRWMVRGAWIEYAQKLNALCIMLEHRYYGKSHPVPDVSVKNLMYLTSRQALGDLANFIGQMNLKYGLGKDAKWIVFGGSYPGSLAAWLRLKYPHLVYAAVSSSGPLIAKMDFQEFYEVVVASLYEKTGSTKCIDVVKKAHDQLSLLMPFRPIHVEKTFRLCKPLKEASVMDIKTLFGAIADAFAEVVQYNDDNRITADGKRPNITINMICGLLTVPFLPAYEKLASVTSLIMEKNDEACLDYDYDDMIIQMQSARWKYDGDRPWFYQTCTEFGFYQTSTAESKAFGKDCDLEYYLQQCQDVFGIKFTPDFVKAAVDNTNVWYGASDIVASRVLYVHGSIDPWHALGLTVTRDETSPVIYIKGTAHCSNMYPSAETDSRALKEARVAIFEQLRQWTRKNA